MQSVINNYSKKLDVLARDERYGKQGEEAFTEKVEKSKGTLKAIKEAQKSSKRNAKLSPPKEPTIKYIGVKQKANDNGMKKSIEVTKFKVKV